jgi:c-di-GMP-binding flagellar brake protein YcgR
MMDNKVNFIIEQMASPSDQPDKIMNAVIELSGSGIKFVSKDPFSKGVFLKMDLIMPDTIEFMVEFIASVVRVESKLPPAEKGVQEYCVAAQFAQIDERVRDAIIETIFKKQRKMIRLEKDQKVD